MKTFRNMAAVAVCALGAFAVESNAASMYYDVAGGPASQVLAYPGVGGNANNGLEIKTKLNAGLDANQFNLNDGESVTIPFFTIWSPEAAVNADDLAAQAITAFLSFDVPSVTAQVGGSTVGTGRMVTIPFLGRFLQGTGAQVTWGGPAMVMTADRTFTVTLSNTTFNTLSVLGNNALYLNGGESQAGTVYATIKQVSSVDRGPLPQDPTAVPLPASVWGGMVTLGGLAGARVVRRRSVEA